MSRVVSLYLNSQLFGFFFLLLLSVTLPSSPPSWFSTQLKFSDLGVFADSLGRDGLSCAGLTLHLICSFLAVSMVVSCRLKFLHLHICGTQLAF